MKEIIVEKQLTDEETDELAGVKLDEDSYDQLITEEAVIKDPEGNIIGMLLKNVVPKKLAYQGWKVLRHAAKETNNRGLAAGKDEDGKTLKYRKKKDGTMSKTHIATSTVKSGIIGYFDRYERIPYCRETAFTMNESEKFIKAIPYIQAVSDAFKKHYPERYEAQKKACDQTHESWVIPETVFTTITVNKNFQTAVHKDVGDLKEGFGVMSILRAGEYTGGHFVFPQYRIAVDYNSGDVLLADVHQWHGNTPIEGTGMFERVTCVMYYREKMGECGSPEEETERAKNLPRFKLPDNEAEGFQATTTKAK